MNPRAYKLILGACGALLGVVLSANILGIGGWSVRTQLRDAPRFSADGVQWAAIKVRHDRLWGRVRLDLDLVALRMPQGSSKIIDPELVRNICGGVLSRLSEFGLDGIGRRDFFLIRVNFLDREQKAIGNPLLPVNVIDGACKVTLKRALLFPRYPAPLDQWLVQDLKFPDGEDGDRVEFYFVWAGEGIPNLQEFPFAKGCAAMVTLPVTPEATAFLAEPALRRVTIIAAQEKRLGFLSYARTRTAAFITKNGVCDPIAMEDET